MRFIPKYGVHIDNEPGSISCKPYWKGRINHYPIAGDACGGDSRIVIYDNKMASTRADVNIVDNLYTFSQDYKGNVLYEKDGSKLYWDKCAFDLGLNSVFLL